MMKKRQVSLATGIALLILIISTMAIGVVMSEYEVHLFQFHRFCAFITVALAIFHAVINLRPYFTRPKQKARARST